MVCLVVYLVVLVFGVAIPAMAWGSQRPNQSFFQAYLEFLIAALITAIFGAFMVGVVTLGEYIYQHCPFGV